MSNYFLTIAYDGTEFNGWQAQGKENLRTVQETLEGVASQAFGQSVKITASGRTDAGVHALGQVCSFQADTTIPPKKIADCLNAKLPSDVRVVKSGLAADGFDACRSAKRKTYVYSLYFSERENPLKERFCVRVGGVPNTDKMLAAAKLLEGEHDFKAYCASNSSAKTTVRTVYGIDVVKERTFSGNEIRIYITGNGFLYNMVRTIVGTLLDVGADRKELKEVVRSLKEKDRGSVGKTMPAKGLCLYSVEYV